MKYEKPRVIIFDEEVLKELQLLAGSKCHCTLGQSKVCYEAQ